MRKDVAKATREVLQNEPYARENDGYLIRRVVEKLEPNLYKKDFREVMDNLQFYKISCESITRARRKFLEQHPELISKTTQTARRIEEENYFLEYSKHVPRLD